MATCADCRFWDLTADENKGWCRRYAPRPAIATRDEDGIILDVFAAWPITLPDDFCGEHKVAYT